MPEDEQHICDVCHEDFEFLYTRECFRFGHSVEFVCKHCYPVTFGIDWESDYGENNDKVQIEERN